MKDDRLYLIHIIECISRVEKYIAEGKEQFLNDTKTQDAVLRNLQILAESAQRISNPVKTKHHEIDWRSVAGFRNILVHDYFGINLTRVWEIVESLPIFKQQIKKILEEMGININEIIGK